MTKIDIIEKLRRMSPQLDMLQCETELQAEIERLRKALVEAEAELIYLRRHGKDGARWEANDSKDVWRDKARAALQQKETK